MLAFHNEHIASCAFLTYFTPDSTTASTSPTALTTTAAAASILNDKQALTGILQDRQENMSQILKKRLPSTQPMVLLKSLPYYGFDRRQRLFKVSKLQNPYAEDQFKREINLNAQKTIINSEQQHQCSSVNNYNINKNNTKL